MSGETETNISAWTVDSLHAHVSDSMDERERRYIDRFESQEKVITSAMAAYGVAVNVANEKASSEIACIKNYYDSLLVDRDLRYEQRFEASKEALSVALAERDKAIQAALLEREKAVQAAFDAQETAVQLALKSMRDFYDTVLSERDDRYEQRFLAQEKAATIALATIDRKFDEQIRAVREETRVALESADKAITKSETANEKRFESVNEFRAQQADMITTFARKDEVDTRLIGLTEKIEGSVSQYLQLAGSTLPRNEYDRAHVDLADKVSAVDKAVSEKLEAHIKTLDQRINQLQAQLSSIEAITR